MWIKKALQQQDWEEFFVAELLPSLSKVLLGFVRIRTADVQGAFQSFQVVSSPSSWERLQRQASFFKGAKMGIFSLLDATESNCVWPSSAKLKPYLERKQPSCLKQRITALPPPWASNPPFLQQDVLRLLQIKILPNPVALGGF